MRRSAHTYIERRVVQCCSAHGQFLHTVRRISPRPRTPEETNHPRDGSIRQCQSVIQSVSHSVRHLVSQSFSQSVSQERRCPGYNESGSVAMAEPFRLVPGIGLIGHESNRKKHVVSSMQVVHFPPTWCKHCNQPRLMLHTYRRRALGLRQRKVMPSCMYSSDDIYFAPDAPAIAG